MEDTQITDVSQFRVSIGESADMQISDTKFKLNVESSDINSDKFAKSDVKNTHLTPKNSGLSCKTKRKCQKLIRNRLTESTKQVREVCTRHNISLHSGKKIHFNPMDGSQKKKYRRVH